MAPERFLGAAIDRGVDVYALACVLYECLTGRRPFELDEPLAFISAHLHAAPPRASVRDPRIPAGLDDVVTTGMAKDPVERYASAGALAAAARAALSGTRAAPPRPGVPTVTESGPVPPPGAGGLPGPAGYRPPPAVPVAQEPRRRRQALVAAAAVLVVGVGVGALITARAAPDPAPPLTAAQPVPDPALSAADRALLTALPPGYTAASCGSDPERPRAATAALRCGAGPTGGPDTAEFVRFADVDALDRVAADEVRGRNLPLDTGSCRDGAAVQTTWSKNGQVAGLLACYPNPAGRTLRWTDHAALASGVITRTDGNSAALYDWWTRHDIGR
jgi:serine/threonine-protein kinase